MARDWKAVFETWTRPASDTEAEKQANAERMIRDAVREYAPLNGRDIKVIAQGSYRNNTNVRAESDVDICVCCTEPFFYDYTFSDYTPQESNVIAHPYLFSEFKNDVEAALVKKFGRVYFVGRRRLMCMRTLTESMRMSSRRSHIADIRKKSTTSC